MNLKFLNKYYITRKEIYLQKKKQELFTEKEKIIMHNGSMILISLNYQLLLLESTQYGDTRWPV